ncbi:hypothetical protein [Streptomyces niveus]
MNLNAELRALAEKIEENPFLELTNFSLGLSAGSESLGNAEYRLGMSLPAPVRNLYESVNGAILSWRFREGVEREIPLAAREEIAAMSERYDVFHTAGIIRILPLEEMLFDDEYEIPQLDESGGVFEFDGTSFTNNEFTKVLRIFDVLNEFTAMAFVSEAGRDDWKILRLTHNWFEFDQSRTIHLDDYLKYVLATWGLLSARAELLYEYRGYLREPVTFDAALATRLVPKVLSGAF